MRYIKIAVIVLFVLCAVIFGAGKMSELKNHDSTQPELTSDREILEIPCDFERQQLLEGLEAYDEKDGDLSSDIIAGDFSRFIEKGTCNVTYMVFDSGNQMASLTRKVHFTDYYSPRFTLSQPLVFREGEGTYEETMNRIGVQDALEGDMKEWMQRTDTDVNYSKAGSYYVEVEVTNSLGDMSSVKLPVHVTASGSRNVDIQLSQWIVYVSPGGSINPADYITGVTDAGGNALDPGIVAASSGVDFQTEGCYEIRYSVDDGQGNIGETWMTVVVQA